MREETEKSFERQMQKLSGSDVSQNSLPQVARMNEQLGWLLLRDQGGASWLCSWLAQDDVQFHAVKQLATQ